MKKHHVANRPKEGIQKRGTGGHDEWEPWVNMLIIEMHANRTPPTCIQANLLAVARGLFPEHEVIAELPSLRHIRRLRGVLCTVTKSLAARCLGKGKSWKQGHSDETGQCKSQLLSLVMSMLDEDDELRTVCLHADIIPKNGTAECQSKAIISSFDESGRLLDEWREMTEEMFPGRQDLLDDIGSSDDMDVTKLVGGHISGDNCSTARLVRQTLSDDILAIAEEKGITREDLVFCQSSCWGHMRNTWAEAGKKHSDRKLTEVLKHTLPLVPPHLRVDMKLMHICRMCDKQCNET